jgi:hypothetical protein
MYEEGISSVINSKDKIVGPKNLFNLTSGLWHRYLDSYIITAEQ